MEKVKLTNGAILEITNIVQSEEKLTLQLPNSNFENLRTIFDNKYNLSTIEILTEGDVVCAVYNGFKKVDQYILVPGDPDIINVTLIKLGDIEERLESVEDAIKTMVLSELGVL